MTSVRVLNHSNVFVFTIFINLDLITHRSFGKTVRSLKKTFRFISLVNWKKGIYNYIFIYLHIYIYIHIYIYVFLFTYLYNRKYLQKWRGGQTLNDKEI
jgi:hypothetical protein